MCRIRPVQRTPSFGRSRASEHLSPVATASPGGWRSKAGSCMSRTSSPTRTTRCPRLWRPGDAPCLGVPLLRDSEPIGIIGLSGSGSSRSPSGRSSWCAPLPTRRSSRWRMRGCSANCRPARATSKNCSNTRPRPATCSRSSAARPPMCNRCWTQWSKRPSRLCGADTGAITIREGEVYRYVASSTRLQRTPSFGRPCASEPLSPVATASPGGWRSKAGSCMSRTSALTRTTRCPRLWRPGDAPCLGCRCCARGPCSARLLSRGSGSSRSPSGRSNWCAPLPTRRSSRWRTRGCSANCRPARATSKNRSNTRPRPATCSTSSAARPPMCNRCWTR